MAVLPDIRRRRRGGRLLASLLATVALMAAAAAGAEDAGTDREAPSHASAPASPHQHVTFEHLEAVRSGGGIVVDYTVDPDDWERLADHSIRLWLDLRIPTDGAESIPWFHYTLPVDERSDELSFPDWLSTGHASEIGICALGTGVGDQLAYGRGYVCRQTFWTDLERRPPREGPALEVEMLYHRGLPGVPYAPWMAPAIPGMPQGHAPPSPQR